MPEIPDATLPDATASYQSEAESRFRQGLRAYLNYLAATLRWGDASVLSSTFAIDSTGVRTVNIDHGLHGTPALGGIQLTVVQETAVDDWAFNMLKVVSVSAAQVVAKINVSTASMTVGSTARLAARIYRRA